MTSLFLRKALHWLLFFVASVPVWAAMRLAGLPLWAALCITIPAIVVCDLRQPHAERGRTRLMCPQIKQAWRDFQDQPQSKVSDPPCRSEQDGKRCASERHHEGGHEYE